MRTLSLPIFIIYLLTCTSSHAQINDSLSAKKLTEIEVSAQSKISSSRSTTPLQTITSQTILEQGLQSVSDAVRRLNGVTLKDYGGIGGLKTVSVRGMGAEHTAISYDGIMVNNVQSGQVDIGRFSLENISIISLNIGQSDDIFQSAKAFSSVGVLNLETNAPDFTKQNQEAYAKITTGSFGLFNPIIYYSRKLNNTFSISANGSWQHADGSYSFKQKNANSTISKKRSNSDIDTYRSELNIYGKFDKAGDIKVKLYYYDSERGLPNVDLYNNYATGRSHDKNFIGQAVYNLAFSSKLKFKSQAKFDYNNTRYTELGEKHPDGKRNIQYIQKEVYWTNSLLYLINDSFSASLSQDLSYNDLDKSDNDKSLMGENVSYSKRLGSLSALALKYNTSRLTVVSSLLGTYISEKDDTKKKTELIYKKISPSISLSYSPFSSNKFRLRAFYKDIFRVPTFTELYYTEIDANIKPESAKQLNLGMTWVGSVKYKYDNYIKLSADAYYNKVNDKIVIRPVSSFFSRTQNLGKVDIKGLDINTSAGIFFDNKKGLDFSANYSYMEALDMTDKEKESYKNQIIYTPKHSGSASVTFLNSWVNISYSFIVSAKRYFWFQNIDKYKINGYTDHNISLYKALNIKQCKLTLQGGIQNLLNKNYEIIKDYSMPGRSFNISIKIKH